MLIASIVAAISVFGVLLVVLINPATSMKTKAAFTGLSILGAVGLFAYTLIPATKSPTNYYTSYNPAPDEGVENYTLEMQEITLKESNFPLLTKWGAIDLANAATYSGHENFDIMRAKHKDDEDHGKPKRMKALMDSSAPPEGSKIFTPPAGDWSEIQIIEGDEKIMLIRRSADTTPSTMAKRLNGVLSRYDFDPDTKADPAYDFDRAIKFKDQDGKEVAIVIATRSGDTYQELVKIDMDVVIRARSLHGIEL